MKKILLSTITLIFILNFLFLTVSAETSNESMGDSLEKGDGTESVENGCVVTIGILNGGGEAGADEYKAQKGENITISFTPNAGYRLPLTIIDNGETVPLGNDWNGNYTISKIEEDHHLEIEFIPDDGTLETTLGSKDSSADYENNKGRDIFLLVLMIAFLVMIIISVLTLTKNDKAKKNRFQKNSSKKHKKDYK